MINFTETSNYFLFFKSNYLEKSLFLPILNKWAINQVLVNQNKKHQLNFVKIISIFQRAGGLSKYFDKTNKNCHFLISGLTSILDLPLILEYYTQLKNTRCTYFIYFVLLMGYYHLCLSTNVKLLSITKPFEPIIIKANFFQQCKKNFK